MATETDQQTTNATEGGKSFSKALKMLKQGRKMSRAGWNGNKLPQTGELRNSNASLYVVAQFPDEHSKMGNPYLYINAKALGGECNPWVPSQTDIFAEDWFEVE